MCNTIKAINNRLGAHIVAIQWSVGAEKHLQ